MVFINQWHKNGNGSLCICPQCGEERRVNEWKRRMKIESDLDAYRDQYPEMFPRAGEFRARSVDMPGRRLSLARLMQIYADVRDVI